MISLDRPCFELDTFAKRYYLALNKINAGEVTEMAEGARLESVCILTGYRGFESLPLRHRQTQEIYPGMPET